MYHAGNLTAVLLLYGKDIAIMPHGNNIFL